MSLPESRRDSEVETSSLSGNAYKSDTNFRREEFLDTFNSQQNVVRMHYYYYGITKTKFSYKIGIKNNGKYNTKIWIASRLKSKFNLKNGMLKTKVYDVEN